MLKVEKTRFVNKIPRPSTTYLTISEIEAILYSMEYRIFDEGCAFIDVEWGESDKKKASAFIIDFYDEKEKFSKSIYLKINVGENRRKNQKCTNKHK